MRLVRAAAVLLVLAAPVALTIACGSRSELFLIEEPLPPGADAGEDVGQALDVFVPDDTAQPEDAVIPPIDVALPDVVPPPICADAGDTLIYTVTTSNSLLRFNPASAQFTKIGTLNCPDPLGRSPFSMAVDRQGAAYVIYYDSTGTGTFPPPSPGNIYRVDLNNASCTATSYVAGQQGFGSFGMAFVSDTTDMNETLYVASDDTPGRLGAINEMSLVLSLVGTFSPEVDNAELTGTGDGRLFAFYESLAGSGSVIAQIDPTTARVIGESQLPTVNAQNGWAFAFWGGDFYMFTSPDGATSDVTRYDPNDGSVVTVARYPEEIDGAGVSTCAPVQ